ncbi:MAG: chemotaxis protein CheX [Oscillospiraceae bacterium]|nr:chemotaxis protein CheX [Oscillospiraceae bacterium]
MFTQLFGHYLLNKGIITAEQLRTALDAMSSTHARLGALAIDAGYMDAGQVEAVHEEQKSRDMRIGDIAVMMGFLTHAQVEELLSKQKTANVVLGQALIDLGYITNQQFAEALAEYKENASFDGTGDEGDKALADDLARIFDLNSDPDRDFYVNYIMLLTRNAIRFIGDDFVFAGCTKNTVIKCDYLCSQSLTGKIGAYTAIGGDEKAFTALASRYAVDSSDEEDSDLDEFGLFEAVDEFVEACVGEFLNLQNGLFAVNLSNTSGIELDLTPQEAETNAAIGLMNGLSVALEYSFGTLQFIVFKK